MDNEFDKKADVHSFLVKNDPSKRYVQHPNAISILQETGSLDNKTILDVGCGSGELAYKLSLLGAQVTGYDLSEKQVALAKKTGIGIFLESSPGDITSKLFTKHDLAVACMVLQYSRTPEELEDFFSSTKELIKSDGSFVGIIFNPNYKRIGKLAYNRVFAEDGAGMRVDFFHNNALVMSSPFGKLSRKDYEMTAKNNGFLRFEWRNLKIDPEGIEIIGPAFWKGYEADCPYIGFIAKK